MPTISGNNAAVNGLGGLMSWTLTDVQAANPYVTSNTAGGTGRGGGIADVTGTLAGKGGNPPVFPNQDFLFEGYVGPDNGVAGTDGQIYSAEMICRQITVNWNWRNNELISWTADLAGRSTVTPSTGAPFEDTTPVPEDYTCGQFISYNGIEVPAIGQATLTITANLFETSNSTTRDANGCFILRGPGPLDWTFNATQEDQLRGLAGYPDIGDRDHELLLGVNPTDNWALNWGYFSGYSNLTANRDGTVVSRQLDWQMNAELAGAIGHVIAPGDTVPSWPAP